MSFLAFVFIFLLLVLVLKSVGFVSEHEAGLIWRSYTPKKFVGSGWVFLVPFRDSLRKVDLREVGVNTPVLRSVSSDGFEYLLDVFVYYKSLPKYLLKHPNNDSSKVVCSLVKDAFNSIVSSGDSETLNDVDFASEISSRIIRQEDRYGLEFRRTVVKAKARSKKRKARGLSHKERKTTSSGMRKSVTDTRRDYATEKTLSDVSKIILSSDEEWF